MQLDIRQLGFGYPERTVGRDASLTVAPGEILCLLGPNGCGKTTLFKTLLGLLPILGGEIVLDSQPLKSLARREIAQRIAYVPQAHGALFPYTVLDIVLMGRVSQGGPFAAPSSEDRRIAAAALAQLGIGSLADRDITRLSGGQRQLVMIARAIAQAAPLIVMDEPTASLDFGNQVVVLTEVRRLAERGTGIVLSTHDPDHAFAVANRVALMRDGVIVAMGTPGDVLNRDRLEAVYGVGVSIETLASGQTVCAPRYA